MIAWILIIWIGGALFGWGVTKLTQRRELGQFMALPHARCACREEQEP